MSKIKQRLKRLEHINETIEGCRALRETTATQTDIVGVVLLGRTLECSGDTVAKILALVEADAVFRAREETQAYLEDLGTAEGE